ncbi:K02A2.6-like [Cordylochernes scorpioides]|uniref:RNA-directed DNA polymerase n=1 Tax=Cordylochernes scorpioides TaxID=51811 RepID=A0ABY6LME0_9ARAC|nr:K02A2.6-like [Cordylochernes scorpioides]
MKLPLTLTCDASAYGISGVLCHIVEGEEKPITFVSRTLSSAEAKYSQTEKEALAIVFATSKLRQYLFGRKFVLKSDHKALTTVFGNKRLPPPLIANRLHRWALELSNFDFDIRYTNKDTMLCADAFSRLPLEEINSREDNIDLVTHDISFLNVTPLDHLIIEEETNKDPVLNKLKEYLLEDPQLAKKDEPMKPFLSKLENFSILQGCIFVDSRAVIPRTCQDQMLKLLYQGHIGINRMKSLARSLVWWPKMDSQIEEFVKECSPCMHNQTAPPAENTPWPRINQPWQRVHVDHFYFRGDYYLLVVDANSNWIEVFPVRGTTSQENIELLRECFARTFINFLNSEFIQRTFGRNECGRRHFQVGDKVLLTRVIQNRRKWFKAQVIRLGYSVYLVKNLKGTFKVHVNQMRTDGNPTTMADGALKVKAGEDAALDVYPKTRCRKMENSQRGISTMPLRPEPGKIQQLRTMPADKENATASQAQLPSMLYNLEKFEGKGIVPFAKFIKDFELVYDLRALDDARKRILLDNHLRGAAREFALQSQQIRLGQGAGEKVRDFAARVSDLAAGAESDGLKIGISEAAEVFIDGLCPSLWEKAHLYQGEPWETLVTKLQWLEQREEDYREAQRSSTDRNGQRLGDMGSKLAELERKMEALETENTALRRQRGSANSANNEGGRWPAHPAGRREYGEDNTEDDRRGAPFRNWQRRPAQQPSRQQRNPPTPRQERRDPNGEREENPGVDYKKQGKSLRSLGSEVLEIRATVNGKPIREVRTTFEYCHMGEIGFDCILGLPGFRALKLHLSYDGSIRSDYERKEDPTKSAFLSSLQTIEMSPQPPRIPLNKIRTGEDIIRAFSHCFCNDIRDMGNGSTITAPKLKMLTSKPVYRRQYPYPNRLVSKVKMLVDELEEVGIIEGSTSLWNSPLFPVAKTDGSVRITMDLHLINEATEFFPFPIPRVEDNLRAFAGAKVFSTLDLTSGFFQIHIPESDRDYFTFSLPWGRYRFTRLPQGAKNSAQVFQWAMNLVLDDLLFKCVRLYIDDVIVYSDSHEQHVADLAAVLERLSKFGLKAKYGKSYLFRDSVEYLGHVIDQNGIKPMWDNVAALRDLKRPHNIKAVRSLLGTVNYYRRFIPNAGEVLAPLSNLLRKGHRFAWGMAEQSAFETVKGVLTSETLLIHPTIGIPFILNTDASGIAVGACLQQEVNRTVRPIAYYSKRLTGPEIRYSTIEKEAYAVVLSLQHFKHLLVGSRVEVHTDHKPITYNKGSDYKNARLSRWAEIIQDFNVTFIYVPGKENTAADFLSRFPCEDDPNLPQDRRVVAAVVRDRLREAVISYHHDIPTGGHFGVKKVMRRLKGDYYWPGVAKAASALHFRPEKPFEHLALDFIGPLETTPRGYSSILTIVDLFTKFPILIPTKDQCANTVVRALLERIITTFGVPKTILSDRGSAFMSCVFKGVCKAMGVGAVNTTAWRPQTKLVFGHELRLPQPFQEEELNPVCEDSITEMAVFYERELVEEVEKTREMVRQTYLSEQQEARAEFEARELRTFETGDLVLVKRMHETKGRHKFEPRYRGPYEVSQRAGDTVYLLKDLETGNLDKIHIDRMKAYHAPVKTYPVGDKNMQEQINDVINVEDHWVHPTYPIYSHRPVEPEEPQETAILRNPLGIVNRVIGGNVGGLEIRRSTRVKKPTGYGNPTTMADGALKVKKDGEFPTRDLNDAFKTRTGEGDLKFKAGEDTALDVYPKTRCRKMENSQRGISTMPLRPESGKGRHESLRTNSDSQLTTVACSLDYKATLLQVQNPMDTFKEVACYRSSPLTRKYAKSPSVMEADPLSSLEMTKQWISLWAPTTTNNLGLQLRRGPRSHHPWRQA